MCGSCNTCGADKANCGCGGGGVWLTLGVAAALAAATMVPGRLTGSAWGARSTTKDIPSLWRSGQVGRAAGISTDGENLYSYALKIGATVNGQKVLYDYTGARSVTTSKHVNSARRYADRVAAPPQGGANRRRAR